MNYGLIEDVIDFKEYVFGASKMPRIPYQEDGNWEPFLPKYESQSTKLGQETSGCTVWGLQNQVETFMKKLYGEEPNYSERFTYLLAGVEPRRGANPHTVYEVVREHGLIEDGLMPMTKTIKEFTQNDITPSLRAKGLNWLYTHDFQHEWLWTSRPANWLSELKSALRTSPIAVSVMAWRQVNDKYVSDSGGNNHWCLLYKIDQDGMWVFDTYDHSKKCLHPDHVIRRAKRIWINKKTKPAMAQHISLLQSIIQSLKKAMKPTLLDVANAGLGTDVSPKDLAKDELGCAESVSNLLKKVWPSTPIILGTWSLLDHFLAQKSNYVRVDKPEPGAIIICATEKGKPFPGHCGVFLENMTIASNDSETGKFLSNYTYEKWKARWEQKGGYKIHLFKHI